MTHSLPPLGTDITDDMIAKVDDEVFSIVMAGKESVTLYADGGRVFMGQFKPTYYYRLEHEQKRLFIKAMNQHCYHILTKFKT